MPTITVNQSEQGRYQLIGSLLFSTVSDVITSSFEPSHHSDNVIIDCSALQSLDSAGIALLLYWKRDLLQRNQTIQLTHLPKQAETMIKTLQVDQVLLPLPA